MIAIFTVTDFSNCDVCADPFEVLQGKSTTVTACRMLLPWHVFPLLMETTGDFDRVREFDKLLFILALGINGLLDSRGVVLTIGEFNSTD